ncbi:MAG: prepilin peptidase [Angelakisella sp.]
MSLAVAYFLLYSIVFLFGSSVGSFLNVVIYRLPLGLSVAYGRSFCPHCHKTLRPYHMVPVLSWFLLRGCCHFCKAPIPVRYPLVEALGGLWAVLFVALYGFSIQTAIYLGVAIILMAISFIDLDTMTIPNGLLLFLLLPVLMSVFFLPFPGLISRFVGIFIISLPLWIIACLIPDAFGGGDIKLMAVCGLLLGTAGSLVAFFAALLLGGSYGIYLLSTGKAKRSSHFAFGPFLCAGILFAMIYGETVSSWYLALLY